MIVIVLLTLGFTPVATQPWQICGDTVVNYTTSSSSRHDANLELLSTKLINKATTNPYHFATDFAGAAPDTIYGLALCRGDMNATACRACIATACRGAQQLCPYRDDATVFYPTCRLRFSSKNFLHPDDYSQIVDGVVNTMNTMDTTNTEPVLPGWDPSNAESAEAITEIIRVLLQETARQAAYNSGAWMFATGRTAAATGTGGSFPALYSMAQCVPALTHRDCSSCLQVISFMATDNFAGRQGGRLLALWCNLRYDTVHFYSGDPMVTIVSPVKEVVPPGPLGVPSRKHKRGMVKVVVPLLASIIGLIISFILIRRRRLQGKGSQDKTETNMKEDETIVWGLEGRSSEFMIYDFSQVLEATANFSEENKLGQGGFGPVYKGRFRDGLEIAVKRLASHSGQGFTQFKNEVQLIANLQHTNLLCNCTTWHQCDIHNFSGYMAPEYASEGLFSVKSDVFSFGVLTLEIVSGKRSSGFHQYGDFINLLGHVSLLCPK
ncbi:hypothetical protein PR202_ga22393 [Eleusine coracana subsp. coracana]|uniref:Cysteine-rich receptor-like protein kinase 25 n=1 Tax=Eleusine coracana subsp. coracana TaxID=191504 RepID=A0AAV5D379_ELECO|nr:hypothetical protein PR202_ga22393 [Eleusine coracana subsp. coracana]